ncbi:hypothetical protein WJX77_002134 [Trebouxia sp. C0004]
MSEALCVALLVSGHPQAFVDLFSLTHGSLASTSTGPASPTSVPQAASLSEETAALLSQELVAAHQAYRTRDYEASYESYQQLAEHFIVHHQLPNAKFFYERCLQVSREHAWTEGQAAAHTNLGMLAEQLGHLQDAEGHYEQHLALASTQQAQEAHGPEWSAAFVNVMKVYQERARTLAEAGDGKASLEALRKWVHAAEQSGDQGALAQAHMQMGLAYQQQGEHSQAVKSLQEYIQLCLHLDHIQAQAQAFCALADCQQLLGNLEGAVQSLQAFLLKSRHHDAQGEAYACCNLGVLYYRQRKYDEALTYFERFFEAARALKDQHVLDVARVNLGTVRAALTFKDYMQVADSDLQTLLLWKNVRMPFKEQAPVTLSVS